MRLNLRSRDRPTKCQAKMAGVTRLELATSGVTGQRSNRLSYTPWCEKWCAVLDLNQ